MSSIVDKCLGFLGTTPAAGRDWSIKFIPTFAQTGEKKIEKTSVAPDGP